MTTSKSTDVYHVTARVFLSNQPLLILEIYCAFVDCCKLENLIKAKLNTACEVIYEMFHILNCGFEIK